MSMGFLTKEITHVIIMVHLFKKITNINIKIEIYYARKYIGKSGKRAIAS